MSDHTPGLWHIRDGLPGEFQVCAPGVTVVVCDARPGSECDANARLIAAAPDLLAACEAIWNADGAREAYIDVPNEELTADAQELRDAWHMIRAAIKKGPRRKGDRLACAHTAEDG